jgi:hypothetical protein
MCLFAEGTTTNGYALLKFKRGAFSGMRTVVPVFASLGDRHMMPTYDSLAFWPMLIMYFSSFAFHNLHLTIMPEFTPTEWMLDNHKAKGREDWEIFGECVREAIARQGNFVLDNHQLRQKI